MKIVYQAKDNTIFETEVDCREYEKNVERYVRIFDFVQTLNVNDYQIKMTNIEFLYDYFEQIKAFLNNS